MPSTKPGEMWPDDGPEAEQSAPAFDDSISDPWGADSAPRPSREELMAEYPTTFEPMDQKEAAAVHHDAVVTGVGWVQDGKSIDPRQLDADEATKDDVIDALEADTDITPELIGVDPASPNGDMTAVVEGVAQPDGSLTITSVKVTKPKRDRAAYMRDYRAKKKAERAAARNNQEGE